MNGTKTISFFQEFFSKERGVFSPFLDKVLYPWELHSLLLKNLSTLNCSVSSSFEGVHFSNKAFVFIDYGAIILPGAYIEGPCYIGKNVKIGHCAYIREKTFLAPYAIVGHSSEVCRSIFFEGAKAPHFNYVGDSIIGRNVNLGAHAVCTNLRLDGKEVAVRIKGKKVNTGARKMGALVGEDSSIGSGSVLNPGTIVSPCSKIYPNSVIKGTYEE